MYLFGVPLILFYLGYLGQKRRTPILGNAHMGVSENRGTLFGVSLEGDSIPFGV